MKNNGRKTEKLLMKSESITERIFEGTNRDKSKNGRKTEKKLDRAEKLCRRALALRREDIANGAAESGTGLIAPIHKLSAILFRRGKFDEAETLLAEVCENTDAGASNSLLTECMGYYGSILCESGRYDKAAEVLEGFVVRAKLELGKESFPRDAYAFCRGFGNAACAFTYADSESGYLSRLFTIPVEALDALAEHGAAVRADDRRKAAYYAASQQLFLTCYETVPGADVGFVEDYAEKCIAACGEDSRDDLYLPAALRLLALARARDCRFADAAETCLQALEKCAHFKGTETRAVFGSLQSIAGDMNLLLGIMHYRVSQIGESIRYFEAAIAAYEADAKGRPLRETGYAEAETELLFMSDAEKCAFACKYIGLARFSDQKSDSLDEAIREMRKGAELLETADPNEPYFLLLASADYHIIAQMCERAGNSEAAGKLDALSRERGMTALSALHASLKQADRFTKTVEHIMIRRRTALRLGLLELYADYTRIAIMLNEPPYGQGSHQTLAQLSFEMGECCRVLGKNSSAVEYFDEVRKHTFDGNGIPYDDKPQQGMYEFSLISRASCLVKCGEIAKARRSFREFVETQRNADGTIETAKLVKIAGLSRDIELNPAECAGYLHDAAAALESGGSDRITAAELYNQEGICWYNASPLTDADSREISPRELSDMLNRFAEKELAAFENAIRVIGSCDGGDEKVMTLTPSLHSNAGECYMRKEAFDVAITHYNTAVAAFERLFATDSFRGRNGKEREPYLIQYALCFKSLGEIYNELGDDPQCMNALSKAIEVMERLDDPAVRNELAACLNARGVVHFRLGEYKQNVEDATRAIALKKGDDGGEINMAIMLKNRSDAYRELGDFKSMQSDLTESIDILGKSKLPEDILSQFYGSHWFSMGVCQEGLNKIGKAADAYRKAVGYMDKNKNADDSDAYMKALCHFRRAICLCRREEQEYYGALYEYNKAIKLIEGMPASDEKNENLRRVLSSRGSLYEAFREIDLAKADFHRAESLRAAPDAAK